jgi:hypothetical protein
MKRYEAALPHVAAAVSVTGAPACADVGGSKEALTAVQGASRVNDPSA